VAASAAALGVRLVEHSAAVQRAQGLVARLDARLAQAKDNGAMSYINREYARRRKEAQAEGRPFMPYTAAKRGCARRWSA
jgi:hypothetical protein